MIEFSWKTKNGNEPVKNQRKVYFTCHPADFSTCFQRITADIFKTHDCAIFYTSDMSAPFSAEDLESSLYHMHLFIMPVTASLLETNNRAKNHDLPYAIKNGINILPFMMEPELDASYSSIFGNRQYLSPYAIDRTEIPYEDKLKKCLDQWLLNDETIARIQTEFKGCLFLSYRKKDRLYANRLMREIHQHKECRDIAIWYDEFLLPGQDFQKNIEQHLQRCDIFALLVTPSLLELQPDGSPNFVVETEYPTASRKFKKPILPIEMLPTDRRKLRKKFRRLPKHLDPKNKPAFRLSLIGSIDKHILSRSQQTEDTPEHLYLIGLAYMEGIDVEADRERGLALITSAAEAGSPEAMEKLYQIYFDGIVPKNPWLAFVWIRRLSVFCEKQYGKSNDRTIDALKKSASVLQKIAFYHFATPLALLETIYVRQRDALGEDNIATIHALISVADAYKDLKQLPQALRLYQKVYELQKRVLNPESPDACSSLLRIAEIYSQVGNHSRALEIMQQIHSSLQKVLAPTDPLFFHLREVMATAYSKIGNTAEAKRLLEANFALTWENVPSNDSSRMASHFHLSLKFKELGMMKEARQHMEVEYHWRYEVYGAYSPKTTGVLLPLIPYYIHFKEYKQALHTIGTWYQLDLDADPDPSKRKTHEEFNVHLLLSTFHDLTNRFIQLDNSPENLSLKNDLLSLQSKILGPNHPHTRKLQEHLFGVTETAHNDQAVSSPTDHAHYCLSSQEALFDLIKRNRINRGEFDKLVDTAAAIRIQVSAGSYRDATRKFADFYPKLLSVQDLVPEEWLSHILTAIEFSRKAHLRMGEPLIAAQLCDMEYALCHKFFGEDHMETHKRLAALANIYEQAGDTDRALALSEKAHLKKPEEKASLEQREHLRHLEQEYDLMCEVWGSDHAKTLTILNDLAYAHTKLNQWKIAASLYAKLHRLRCETLGAKDAKTLTALHWHAYAYMQLGKYQEAVGLLEQVFTLRCQIFSECHRDTIAALEHLAVCCRETAEKERSLDYYARVYALRCVLLGNEDLKTLCSLQNLAIAYGECGDHAKQLELSQTAYTALKTVAGEKNPNTIISLYGLAHGYHYCGHHEKAMELYMESYQLKCEVLGIENESTIKTLLSWEKLCDLIGPCRQAIPCYEGVYAYRRKTLGEDHMETLSAKDKLIAAQNSTS